MRRKSAFIFALVYCRVTWRKLNVAVTGGLQSWGFDIICGCLMQFTIRSQRFWEQTFCTITKKNNICRNWCQKNMFGQRYKQKKKNETNFCSFINLFKSALHVSGDKFAHHQEHFLTVYTAFGTMHRHCCRPVPRLRWSSISTVAPVGSSVDALYQKLYIQSKSAPDDGRICRPKHVGLN